jgi:hypothetical protein
MSNNGQLSKLVTYEQYNEVDNDLQKIYKLMEKEFKQSKKPNSFAQRMFVDLFGVVVLYVTFFFLCDLTRSVLTDSGFFGIKWLFFGPYYFFTGAPFMTRIWRSKKFIEDLAEFRDANVQWQNNTTCTTIATNYTTGCNSEQRRPNHPIRNNLGGGLDWVISHVVGNGALGGIIGESTCEEQGDTIGRTCADDRCTAAYNCYQFFCSVNNITHVCARQNSPNDPGTFDQQTRGWDDPSKYAYSMYYAVYTAIYRTGSIAHGGNFTPSDLNPDLDTVNQYCINPRPYFGVIFTAPNWFITEDGMNKGPTFFQQNYKNHELDYWD